MNVAKIVARWMLLPFAWIAAFMFGSVVGSLAACQMSPEVNWNLGQHSAGFGGHWILGPLLVTMRTVLAGWIAMTAVVWVAPSHKRETGFVAAAVIATVTLFGVFIQSRWYYVGVIPLEELVRWLFEAIPPAAVGFIVAASVPNPTTSTQVPSYAERPSIED